MPVSVVQGSHVLRCANRHTTMKHLYLALCLLLLSGITQAQEKVWYCVEDASAGQALNENSGKWDVKRFTKQRQVIKQPD